MAGAAMPERRTWGDTGQRFVIMTRKRKPGSRDVATAYANSPDKARQLVRAFTGWPHYRTAWFVDREKRRG